MSLEPQNLSQKKRFQLLDIGDKQNEIHMTVSLKWMERLCTPDCSESNTNVKIPDGQELVQWLNFFLWETAKNVRIIYQREWNVLMCPGTQQNAIRNSSVGKKKHNLKTPDIRNQSSSYASICPFIWRVSV